MIRRGVPSRVCDDPGAGRIFYEFRDETSRDEAWMDIWAFMSVSPTLYSTTDGGPVSAIHGHSVLLICAWLTVNKKDIPMNQFHPKEATGVCFAVLV